MDDYAEFLVSLVDITGSQVSSLWSPMLQQLAAQIAAQAFTTKVPTLARLGEDLGERRFVAHSVRE